MPIFINEMRFFINERIANQRKKHPEKGAFTI